MLTELFEGIYIFVCFRCMCVCVCVCKCLYVRTNVLKVLPIRDGEGRHHIYGCCHQIYGKVFIPMVSRYIYGQ